MNSSTILFYKILLQKTFFLFVTLSPHSKTSIKISLSSLSTSSQASPRVERPLLAFWVQRVFSIRFAHSKRQGKDFLVFFPRVGEDPVSFFSPPATAGSQRRREVRREILRVFRQRRTKSPLQDIKISLRSKRRKRNSSLEKRRGRKKSSLEKTKREIPLNPFFGKGGKEIHN